jgi:hypothetical protein
MSRWADWIPLASTEVEQFRLAAAADEGADREVLELLEPWLEQMESLPHHVAMDKAWEPIHRCLTGDFQPTGYFDVDAGERPLKLCVMGGEHLLSEGQRTLVLVSAEDVPAVAAALANVTKDWFRERFFSLPDAQFHTIDEEACEWAWAEFEQLPPFFAKVAETGRAVMCTISH